MSDRMEEISSPTNFGFVSSIYPKLFYKQNDYHLWHL